MQRIVLGAVAVLTIAALVAAVVALDRSGGLGKKMTGIEADIADLGAKLSRAQNDLSRHRDSAARLENTEKRINAAFAELAALSGQTKSQGSEIQSLTQKSPVDRSQISALAKGIEANKAELSNLRRELELANENLASDQARAVSPGRSVVPSPAISPTIPAPQTAVKPPSTSAVTESETAGKTTPRQSDLVSDARRRFQSLDENRDDRVDRIEFRLGKIQALILIDSNQDGSVTIDETLLSPDMFGKFDRNGDGKISQFEFIDSQSFAAIDADRDGQVTFEEYRSLLRDR